MASSDEETHVQPDTKVFELDLRTGDYVDEPPPDLNTPTVQGPVGDGSGAWKRAYVGSDGSIDVDVFEGPAEADALDLAEVIQSNLQSLLDEKGWSPREASERLHKLSRGTLFKSPDFLQRMLSGRRTVHAEDLYWMCQLFEVAVWRILLPPTNIHMLIGRTLLGRDGASELLFHAPGEAIDRRMRELSAEHIQRRERRRTLLKDLEVETVLAMTDLPPMPGETTQDHDTEGDS